MRFRPPHSVAVPRMLLTSFGVAACPRHREPLDRRRYPTLSGTGTEADPGDVGRTRGTIVRAQSIVVVGSAVPAPGTEQARCFVREIRTVRGRPTVMVRRAGLRVWARRDPAASSELVFWRRRRLPVGRVRAARQANGCPIVVGGCRSSRGDCRAREGQRLGRLIVDGLGCSSWPREGWELTGEARPFRSRALWPESLTE